jgi:hypothetical protein
MPPHSYCLCDLLQFRFQIPALFDRTYDDCVECSWYVLRVRIPIDAVHAILRQVDGIVGRIVNALLDVSQEQEALEATAQRNLTRLTVNSNNVTKQTKKRDIRIKELLDAFLFNLYIKLKLTFFINKYGIA